MGGWRFSWRADRLQQLHELGRAFGETEDSAPAGAGDEPEPVAADDQPDGDPDD